MVNRRIAGFDYLRAIMSIFVVVWHMGGAGQSLIFSELHYKEHIFTVSDLVNFNILLLAVPTFIFMSIFLYASKGANKLLLKKRLIRLFILLTFWPIALILYKSGYQGLLDIIPHSISSFISITLRAGSTIYYFFLSLIICLICAHFILQLKQQYQMFSFALSIAFFTWLPEITKILDFYPLSSYWSPLNFIPVTLAAVIVSQNMDYICEKKKMLLFITITLSVVFAAFEWNFSIGNIFFPGQGYAIPAYTRTSLLFGVLTMVLIAFDPRIKTNPIVMFMSKYSLALYCVHPFLLSPVKKLVIVFVQNELLRVYISIFIVIIFSYLIAMMLKKYYLKENIII